MGIAGLLPALKDVTRPAHVSAYAGQAVAVDAYCWLHRGSYACAREMCEGIPNDAYVRYCMDRVRVMLAAGVQPVVVFDGGRLPAKAGEEAERQRKRADALARARAHAAAGNAAAALDCYRRAVDITPAAARRFIDALRDAGVSFLVAPYEADAQMAYLARRGDVAAVVTEDSDLLPYGCPRVLFKMDKHGHGFEVAAADILAAPRSVVAGFTPDMFLQACVLAGCDFVNGVPGVGVRKAVAALRRHRDWLRVLKGLRFAGTPVPHGHEAAVQRALWTFRHQTVFCPTARTAVPLTPLPVGGLAAPGTAVAGAASACVPEGGVPDFLGPSLDAATAAGVAEGRLDPFTRRPYVDDGGGGGPVRGSGGRGREGAPGPRPLPVARNAIAALFSRAAAAEPGARREFVAPRRAMADGGGARGAGGAPAPVPSGPPATQPPPGAWRAGTWARTWATPAARAAAHPDGSGSQPPERVAAAARRAPSLSSFGLTGTTTASLCDDADDGEDGAASPLLEQELAAERGPYVACFATPGSRADTAGGRPPDAGPRWAGGETPAGWRAFYAESPDGDGAGQGPEGAEDGKGPRPQAEGAPRPPADPAPVPLHSGPSPAPVSGPLVRRSIHFAHASPPTAKRPAHAAARPSPGENDASAPNVGPPPSPAGPFGGLSHVADCARRADAAVAKRGRGRGRGASPPAAAAAGGAFARFAFGQ